MKLFSIKAVFFFSKLAAHNAKFFKKYFILLLIACPSFPKAWWYGVLK